MFRTAAVLLALGVGGSYARAGEQIIGPVDFERHIVGLLGKSGCSAGSCHGSFQGKGGLRLSLFGFEPEKDFVSLTRGGGGRRVNTVEPNKSLLFLKATGQVQHGGGKRFDVDSWQAKVFLDWISSGAHHVPGSGVVESLSVLPAEQVLERTGETTRLIVRAKFTDGTTMNVTQFGELRAKDDSVVAVSPFGEIRATRAGDTAIIASYRGITATARVFVPASLDNRPYPSVPEVNEIDREVFAKLKRLNIVPSDLATDEEFLRRVTIDTTASLPSPTEVKAFLADRDPKKRAKLIDKLLSNPLHAAVWATKMCDITACNVDAMSGAPEERVRAAQQWHGWFRQRFAENTPYDKIARGVLTATSRDGHALKDWIAAEVNRRSAKSPDSDNSYAKRGTLDLFWMRFEGEEYFSLEKMAELTATAFLGVRLECAQCHRHPFDRWTQTDYRAFANVFGQIRLESSPELTAAMFDLLEERRKLPMDKAGPAIPRLREVYLSDRPRHLTHPDTHSDLKPKALGGPVLTGNDPRASLFEWMVQPDNPYFARTFVNRVWAHYFGIGLIDPVDDLSANNPPSNERLLDLLAANFIKSGYDVRLLERTILSSRTYQLSSSPNDTNRADRSNFSRSYPRKLMAEVVLDVLNDALGTKEDFGRAASGKRAIEVAANRVNEDYAARLFRIFDRPLRTSTCDCERPSNPALPQTLFLMTDPALLKKISTGRLAKLFSAKMSDARIVDELFLATLSRLPDQNEKTSALDRASAASDREAGLTDVLWALVNTREFILNH
jgi:hypothetical protein